MDGYVVIPLVSCIVSAMVAAALLARDARRRANRLAAVLVGGAAWWAACEVLWNTAGDPAVVMRLVRLSAAGWCFLGPLSLDMFCEVAQAPAPQLRRTIPWLYGVAAVFLAAAWTTPLFHAGTVSRETWGWSYDLSPTYLIFYLFTMACIGLATRVVYRTFRNSPSSAEREQVLLLLVGISIPATVASLTDGILPLLDIQLPRLGTASFAVLNGIIAFTFYRYTYPIVAPTAFGREIFENMADGVALLRADGHIRTANSSLARLVGTSSASLEERAVDSLLPELGDPLRGVAELEIELVDESGERLPVAVSTGVVEERTGQPMGVVLVVRDLREVVSLRHRLVTSGRLAAVGELAAGIAHEINNPIAFARANLAQLGEHWEDLAKRLDASADAAAADLLQEGREMIAESIEGVDRAAAIVRDVKGFSHAGHSRREAVDLNALLDGVLRVAASQVREHRIETVYGEIPPVQASQQELKQVFLNLVLNAAQAILTEGHISVRTFREGGWAVVAVEDDGCGMDEETRSRIFDPFFTTKDVGEGTGLGLAIAYQIVRNHGGEIRVDSEPGEGTRFEVWLPGQDAPDADAPPRLPERPPPTKIL